MNCIINKELTIETMRALAAAANSLRFNPELDPDIAFTYEEKVHNMRHLLEQILNESPNDPLMPEDLQEMVGEPVWLHTYSAVQKKTTIACWAIVETVSEANITFVRAGCNSRLIKWFANYNERWLAYRRKPEERA